MSTLVSFQAYQFLPTSVCPVQGMIITSIPRITSRFTMYLSRICKAITADE